MMWPTVLRAWVAMLRSDAALTLALGGDHVYPAQAARPVRIPSVEYTTPIIDRETELFNEVTVQVDYWARGVSAAAVIEERLRLLTHRDVARRIALPVPAGSPPGTEPETLYLWMRYLDSRTHEYRAEQGVVHRSLDFLFEPLRARFHA